MQKSKDHRVVQHILEYCGRIDETANYFNNDKDAFNGNHVFRDAIALCVLQIGELTGVLSDSIKERYDTVPWRQIKALRNIVAHRYGTVDAEVLWEILTNDIPKLKIECESIMRELEDDVHNSCDEQKDNSVEGYSTE